MVGAACVSRTSEGETSRFPLSLVRTRRTQGLWRSDEIGAHQLAASCMHRSRRDETDRCEQNREHALPMLHIST
jgi:hypothetical protein